MTIVIATPYALGTQTFDGATAVPASKTKLHAQRIGDLYLDFYLRTMMQRADNVTAMAPVIVFGTSNGTSS